MKLFIYEHITSGALIDEPLPPSLAHEGDAMLQSAINDFIDIENIELILLRDSRMKAQINIAMPHQCYLIHNQQQFQQYYHHALDQADTILPVAPETDEILYHIQQQIIEKNKILLGCRPETTAIVSDKLTCAQHLSCFNLLTPNTIIASEWSHNHLDSPCGYVIKPRDGAGCLDTYYFPDKAQCDQWINAQAITTLQSSIIQPFIQGMMISLTVLFSNESCLILSINEQFISIENSQLTFHGVNINPDSKHPLETAQLSNLLGKLHHALPGLWGFVGIDLVLEDNRLWIIDINPRLTTSYIGLRRSIQHNPAQLLLTMMNSSLDNLPSLSHPIPVEVRL